MEEILRKLSDLDSQLASFETLVYVIDSLINLYPNERDIDPEENAKRMILYSIVSSFELNISQLNRICSEAFKTVAKNMEVQ